MRQTDERTDKRLVGIRVLDGRHRRKRDGQFVDGIRNKASENESSSSGISSSVSRRLLR